MDKYVVGSIFSKIKEAEFRFRSATSLLILAEEVLSRGLQELVSLKMITPYHALRSCQTLSHLLFANDVLVLYNGHKRNLKKLQIFLETSKKLIVMAKR